MLQNPSRLKPFQTKEEYVYDILRSAIMNAELKPGERLIVDSLADELKVSPIPIRGALQRLQSEGLVQITPHTGAVVSEISIDMVDEIFLLLEYLESMAFEIAASKASSADMERLDALISEMDEALAGKDVSSWSELNNAFHRRVADISEMKLLVEFTSRVLDSWDRLRRYYLKETFSEKLENAQKDHRDMVGLLRAHDLPGLMEVIKKHNRKAQEDYRRLLN